MHNMRMHQVVWSDCDTYFMNMSVTIENVLFTYAGQEQARATVRPFSRLRFRRCRPRVWTNLRRIGGIFVNR